MKIRKYNPFWVTRLEIKELGGTNKTITLDETNTNDVVEFVLGLFSTPVTIEIIPNEKNSINKVSVQAYTTLSNKPGMKKNFKSGTLYGIRSQEVYDEVMKNLEE